MTQNPGSQRPDGFLSEVRLERFKAAFKPAPIRLERFNVVIGRNGSGKSTLLEALQWIATTIRRDAREACDRYYGIRDLINLRSQVQQAFFEIELTWQSLASSSERLRYDLKVSDRDGAPEITSEELTALAECHSHRGHTGAADTRARPRPTRAGRHARQCRSQSQHSRTLPR